MYYNTDFNETMMISYQTSPEEYKHWKLEVSNKVAFLILDIDEDGGIQDGYQLKLNSYDLGVDIELNDALNRIRFEHPNVQCVVFKSGKNKMFCSGANIYMLGQSIHSWKVNFCKFTNETRNGIEDSSQRENIKFIAAINGTVAGGGYELALACDKILMIDDRSSTVSLPEVPLLGVLPGTGGLTRLTDKRGVRKDHADIFCTTSEGIKAERALEWKIVDFIAKPKDFENSLQNLIDEIIEDNEEKTKVGIKLEPVEKKIDDHKIEYNTISAKIDNEKNFVEIIINGPKFDELEINNIVSTGCTFWLLTFARDLEDLILHLRTNVNEIGLWVFKSKGSAEKMRQLDAFLSRYRNNWFIKASVSYLRRTLQRLETSSRSIFTLIEQDSCFAGSLYEIALASDRVYMKDLDGIQIGLSMMNFGAYPTITGLTRMHSRFSKEGQKLENCFNRFQDLFDAKESSNLGLVTLTPDELDWDDEIRLAIEERASISPDALTGLEANLRFGGDESLQSKIFGRLTAWQNWVFSRPNAVGDEGALKVFGSGKKPKFNKERI